MESMGKRLSKAQLDETAGRRDVSFAKKGIVVALIGAIAYGTYGVVIEGAYAYPPFDSLVYSGIAVAAGVGFFQELISTIIMLGRNAAKGRIREYGRAIRTKSGAVVMIGAIFGGPLAVTCSLLGVQYCGAGYAMAICALYPLFATILGILILKEKAGVRFWVALAMILAGAIIVSYSPSDINEYPNFYLGLIFSAIAGISWGIESFTGTLGTDCLEAESSTGLRYLASFCGYMILAAFTGSYSFIAEVITTGMTGLLIEIVAVAICVVSVVCWYKSMGMCGCGRAASINGTSGLWTTVVGLLLSLVGLSQILITTNLVIGAVLMAAGIVVVVSNPKELVNLRK